VTRVHRRVCAVWSSRARHGVAPRLPHTAQTRRTRTVPRSNLKRRAATRAHLASRRHRAVSKLAQREALELFCADRARCARAARLSHGGASQRLARHSSPMAGEDIAAPRSSRCGRGAAVAAVPPPSAATAARNVKQ
jgi:hypothetical protein